MKIKIIFLVLMLCTLIISPCVADTYTASSMGRLARSYTTPTIYNDVNWTSLMDMNQSLNGFAWSISSSFDYGEIVNLRVRTDSQYYRYLYRTWFGFNTSGMTDGYKQNDVKLNMRCMNKFNSYENWFGNVSFVALTAAPIGNISDRFLFDRSVSYGNICLDEFSANTWESIPISSDFPFNTEGITYIGVVFESDRTQIEPGNPSTVSGIPFSLSVYYNSYKPYLTVESEEPPKICDIDVSPSSGNVPLQVTFTDASSGFNESLPYPTYSLSFGDGGSWDGERQYTGENWFHTYYTAGTYNYSYAVTEDGESYYSNGTITVSETDSNFYVLVAGLNTAPISGANVTIWYNGELQDWEGSGLDGRSYFDVPPNRWVNGTVTKTGYQAASYSQYISTWDTWKTVTLYADNETPGSGDEYWNYIVTFRDASTMETLTNVFVSVYTDAEKEDLFLSETSPYGVWTGLLPNGTTFYFTASAENHIDAEWSYTLSGASVSVYKDLLPVIYGGLEPVLNIFVYDTGGNALKDVGVSVDSDTDDGFHLTNITGFARHFCDSLAYGSSRSYTITAQKGGYVTESSTVTVSTSQPTVYIFMDKSGSVTATPTVSYTPVETPFWSGEDGEPGNIKEQLINTLMTQFGVSQLEANILMGIILTLLCACVVGGALASYGSGSGAGVGAMIGAVVGFSGSSVIGFFPIWILIVVIVLVFAAWFMFRGRDE